MISIQQIDHAAPPALPPELLIPIAEHLRAADHLRTLSSFLLASHATYTLLSPTLYHTVQLNRRNASQIFAGLAQRPSRSRRHDKEQRRTKSAGINMGVLLSRIFYLEWTAAMDDRPNEITRSGRYHLVWPRADADSDEEEEEEDVEVGDPSQGQDGSGPSEGLRYPFPTFASHRRKLSLLAHIDHLIIDEIPSRHLCDELEILVRSGGQVFSPVRRLSIGASAFFRLLDWEDRHPHKVHPFRALLAHTSPRHVCVTYPTVDRHLEQRYMEVRAVTNEEHISRQTEVDQYTFLRFRLRQLLDSGYAGPLDGLIARWPRLASLTVHRVAMEQVPMPVREGLTYRVEFHPCACRDGDVLDPVVDTSCYNHCHEDMRWHTIANLILCPDAQRVKWEFVDSGTIGGTTECGRETAERFWNWWEHERKDVRVAEELKADVTFTTSDKASACSACGSSKRDTASASVGFR